MPDTSKSDKTLSDMESFSRVIIGSAGAFSGAAIAIGVPLASLRWGQAPQYTRIMEQTLGFAIVVAIVLGSLISFLSVYIATRKR